MRLSGAPLKTNWIRAAAASSCLCGWCPQSALLRPPRPSALPGVAKGGDGVTGGQEIAASLAAHNKRLIRADRSLTLLLMSPRLGAALPPTPPVGTKWGRSAQGQTTDVAKLGSTHRPESLSLSRSLSLSLSLCNVTTMGVSASVVASCTVCSVAFCFHFGPYSVL